MLGHDVTCHDAGTITLRCRPDALRRAVRNLLENALRYAGHARVTVRESDRQVEILVEDNGPGIPTDQLARVFEPFYRVEQSRSAATGGVGLGLAIVRAVARQHGGEVTLRPNAPGLSASIVLPRD
jgi:signal transduction histidine kinase